MVFQENNTVFQENRGLQCLCQPAAEPNIDMQLIYMCHGLTACLCTGIDVSANAQSACQRIHHVLAARMS